MEQKKSYILLEQDIIDNCIDSLKGNDYINYGDISDYQLKILVTNIGAYYNAEESCDEHLFYKRNNIYLNAETFICKSVNNQNTIIKKFSELDVLIVYGLQFLSAGNKIQDKFICILRNLIKDNKKIILMGDVSPKDLHLKKELIELINGLNIIKLKK